MESETVSELSSTLSFRTSRRYGSRSTTIAADLGEHIVAGRLKPATILRVDALATEYGVSPTPVREALHTLAAEGLVTKTGRSGYSVARLTANDITDVFLVAAFVAGELAARAAVELSDEDLSELRAIHHETMALIHRNDLEHLDQKSRAFHSLINSASESSKLRWLARITTRYIPRSLFTEIPGWTDLTAQGQVSILEALESRDPEAARKAATGVLTRAGKALSAEVAERSAES
ncbi:GntR family transcriptional regulator [Brevibacterium paucivorans]